jgi:hypothetical protein
MCLLFVFCDCCNVNRTTLIERAKTSVFSTFFLFLFFYLKRDLLGSYQTFSLLRNNVLKSCARAEKKRKETILSTAREAISILRNKKFVI